MSQETKTQVTYMRDSLGAQAYAILCNTGCAGKITFTATTATVYLTGAAPVTFDKGNSRASVKAAKLYVNRALRASATAPAAPQLASLLRY